MMGFVSAIAAIIAAFLSAVVVFLMTRKADVVLTFNNDKDRIDYKLGESRSLGFFLKNTGKVGVYSVEAVVYLPKGVSHQLGKYSEEAQYFESPPRIVLRVNTIPPKSSPKQIITPWSVKLLPEPERYEFKYEITGEKVKARQGRLIAQSK